MKFNSIKYLIFFVLIFCINISEAQEQNPSEIVEQKIQEIAENTDAEYDYSELYDVLIYYLDNPLNINSASRDQLNSLFVLNPIQIENIILYRKKNGYFLSVYELTNVDGLYSKIIQIIEPFIITKEPEKKESVKFSNMMKYGRHNIITRYAKTIEEKEGYKPISDSLINENPNSRYLGPEYKAYFRYNYKYKDKISWSLVGDKDSGEEFFKGNNKQGFDFYSAHFYMKDIGFVKEIVIGDYNLSFGQGLTIWSGFGFGKSPEATDIRKFARGISPSSSANEFSYLRGSAINIGIGKNIELIAFYSNKNLDGNITEFDTISSEEALINSIQESGYHRTVNEMAKKNVINEQTAGGRISYKNKGLIMGITSQMNYYDKDIAQDSNLYKIYNFQGKKNVNYGFDLAYTLRKFSVFGEYALDKDMDYAALFGLMWQADPKALFSLIYRNYSPQYNNFYSVAFGEASSTANEEGLYVGAKLFLGSKSILKVYYDIFKFPWLRYRVNLPSIGDEFSLQYEYDVNRNTMFYLRFKSETKAINNTAIEGVFRTVDNQKKQSLRLNLDYSLNRDLSFKSRVEFSKYTLGEESPSNGYLLLQDVKYKILDSKMSLYLRYALFNTDDYNSRIYAYENDLLYYFSIPAYSYKGQRFYFMTSYKVNRNLALWIKYSNTFYNNRESVGTGLEETKSNIRSDIRVQMQLKF